MIADFGGVSERTIYRWNKKEFYHTTYWHQRHGRKWGRKPKLVGENLKLFLDYVDKNRTKNQQEMADYASQLVGQPITRFIISRTLKKKEIFRKKITYHYAEQDKEKIAEFESIFHSLLDLPILSLDECSFPLNLAPRYGYSKRGLRIDLEKSGKRGNSYTLILCVANVEEGGIILWQLTKDRVDAKVFHNFLSQINFLTKDKNYLVMDNVRIHHANQACKKLGLSSIKELLASKNIEALYLPPYTPELNPTELVFNVIKQRVEKCQPETYEELEVAIKEVLNILHEKDMTRYFSHCSEYFEYKLKPEKGWEKCNMEKRKKQWDLFFKE